MRTTPVLAAHEYLKASEISVRRAKTAWRIITTATSHNETTAMRHSIFVLLRNSTSTTDGKGVLPCLVLMDRLTCHLPRRFRLFKNTKSFDPCLSHFSSKEQRTLFIPHEIIRCICRRPTKSPFTSSRSHYLSPYAHTRVLPVSYSLLVPLAPARPSYVRTYPYLLQISPPKI